MIKFGTDGWRAIIADNFTFENLRLVSQAVADSIHETHDGNDKPEIVIGYDTRFLSDRFAAEVAKVMAGNDIVAWLSRADAPTPAISYNVVEKKAAAGVVITASHNPPRYNGFKLKASYGGSATKEQSTLVEQYLNTIIKENRTPRMMDYQEAEAADMIRRFDPSWVYFQHLSEFLDMDRISERELSVVTDAMYGSGRRSLGMLLQRTRTRVTEIRGYMNPGFGGIHPEPILKYLTELVATIQREHADVGLATDGDADRIGAVDNQGNYVDPHTIFALVLRHLIENKGMSGDVVKTISTSFMVENIAKKHGLKLHETPVGFNHIGDLMMKGDVLMGGEESGGMSIKGHIPEGDGVLMGLLLLEVMAYHGGTLSDIIAELQDEYGPARYARDDVRLKRRIDKKEMVKMLEDNAPQTLNNETVKRINTMDGIKYYMADDSWLLIRPSGTEPVLRIYAEARSDDAVKALLIAGGEMGQSIIGE
ncbi:MAG: phosphoglucomutase/phosphomannomutase family protein [Aggregatilineales bacterium]